MDTLAVVVTIQPDEELEELATTLWENLADAATSVKRAREIARQIERGGLDWGVPLAGADAAEVAGYIAHELSRGLEGEAKPTDMTIEQAESEARDLLGAVRIARSAPT